MIDDGDALATVNAIPGDEKMPCSAYASFTILQTAKINAISSANTQSSSSYFVMSQRHMRKGDFSVSYYMLDGDESTYSGMAKQYRRLLFGKDDTNTISQTLPLYLGVIGDATITKNIGGVPVKKNVELTDSEQVTMMLNALNNDGARVIPVLIGFGPGGYHQTFLKSSQLSSKLQRTVATLKEYGTEFVVNYDPLYAYRGGLTNSTPNSYIARMLSSGVAQVYDTNPAYFSFDKDLPAKYVLNPSGTAKAFQTLHEIADRGQVRSFMLSGVGRAINADYNEKNEVERQQVLQQQIKLLESFADKADNLMITTGNAPLVPYADAILELPLTSSGYDITDYSVPFAAMVYSGNVVYSGQIMNLGSVSDTDYLHLIESGAAPCYMVAADNAEKLKDTELSSLFSIDFDYLLPQINDCYQAVSDALEDAYGFEIVSHTRIQENVFETMFSSGQRVIVNYNSTSVTLPSGETVAAASYIRRR